MKYVINNCCIFHHALLDIYYTVHSSPVAFPMVSMTCIVILVGNGLLSTSTGCTSLLFSLTTYEY